jgi:hypothetical protein
MRPVVALSIVGALSWLSAATAGAGEPPKDKSDATSRAAQGTTTSAAPGGAQAKTTPEGGLFDLVAGRTIAKWWEIGIGWETHALLRQNDLAGQAPNKLFNFFYFFGRINLTANDRLSVRGGFYERFIADQEESGMRMSDLSFTYAHKFKLPGKVDLSLSGTMTAPTSFSSQKQGEITSLTAGVNVEREFGPVGLSLRLFGGPNFVRYAVPSDGGNPNASGVFGALFAAEVKIPKVTGLVVGLDFYTAYLWYYNVYNSGNANISVPVPSVDPTFSGQPMQQVYGGEIFVRYELPKLKGLKTEITVAFAQGDPTLGYTSILHDGVSHIYGFWRTSSEVYGAVVLKY